MSKTETRIDEPPSSARFSIEGTLGQGGFGIVYRAFDHKRGIPVAIKTLARADPSRLYRLKQEFRTLADLVHPNLVALYELLGENDQWFFTMELIEGVSFLHYLRGSTSIGMTTTSPTLSVERSTAVWKSAYQGADLSVRPPFDVDVDFDRLRDSTAQLIRGLGALHDAGKLHCDIKPSNVLVERGGRVVILDFGLVTEADDLSPIGEVSGTPRYMAPEQAEGRLAGPASDWYSLGVLLYECITGTLPFGTSRRTPDDDHLPVSYWNPSVPEEIEAICDELLRLDPSERPSRAKLLQVFESSAPANADRAPALGQATSFVGRAAELAVLRDAFRATRKGNAVVVRVEGTSGIGKSAVVRHFLHSMALQDMDAVVLNARCFDRESVPYKALDGAIDGLSQFLRYLSPEEADACMPREIGALARLFPVLRRVPAVAGAKRRTVDIADPQELRRRAFEALRELLSRLAAVRPVAVFIDDLQWGDPDSIPLIETLLRDPDSPAMLLVVTYRSEEVGCNEVLDAVLPVLAGARDSRRIVMAGLDRDEARRLAMMFLPDAAGLAEMVAEEANGHPFFIDALLRYRRADRHELRAVTLEQVFREQLSRLPEAARSVVELLSVAARPVSYRVLCDILHLPKNPAWLGVLRTERLVRHRGSQENEEIEPYHDRVRETVVALLAPERLRSHHLGLAHAFAAQADGDAEEIARHFDAGGQPEQAAEYAELAADRAAQGLAFDRAVRLYRLALQRPVFDPAQERSLLTRLGDALTNAGRGRDAAATYAKAAETAPAVEKNNLLRMAAEQFLVTGHFDEGLDTLRVVLGMVGLELPKTVAGAVWSILWRRSYLRLLGYGFRTRAVEQIAPQKLMRIDVCSSAVLGLAMVDGIRAIAFQARHVMLALRAGEPVRVARCLAVEVGVLGAGGGRTWKRTNRVRELALSLAETTNDTYALYVASAQSGTARYFNGQWAEALKDFDRAESLRPEFSLRSGQDASVRTLSTLFCWHWSGDWLTLAQRLPVLMQGVQDRGDLLGQTNFRVRFAYVSLIATDGAERARAEVRSAIAAWTRKGFFFQHYYHLYAETELDLYSGDPASAWGRLQEQWAALEGSQILRLQFFLIEASHLRARTALALASTGAGDREKLFQQALSDAKRIEKEKMAWARGLALLIRAGVEKQRGNLNRAGEYAAAAEQALETAQVKVYAAAAQYRRGELFGDAQAMERARESLVAQRISNVDKLLRLLTPGLHTTAASVTARLNPEPGA